MSCVLSIINRLIIGRRREECADGDTETTTFVHLPSEIMTKIVLYLNSADRHNLSGVNHRLKGIDGMAGHRSFSNVTFSTDETGPKIEAQETEGRQFEFRLDDLEKTTQVLKLFFNHSTTNKLTIANGVDEGVERKLIIAFKTLDYEKLEVIFNNDCSGRLIGDFVRGRESIDQLLIVWCTPDKDIESAKQVFMDLPPINKCKIFATMSHLFFDDELFLHLVSNSNRTSICCPNTSITTRGLTRSFEMVYNSEKEKKVACSISLSEVAQWSSQLNNSRFEVFSNGDGQLIEHRDSGAVFCQGVAGDELFAYMGTTR